jgi:hypothetical protein
MGLWNDENGDVEYTLSQGEVGIEVVPYWKDTSHSACAVTYSKTHDAKPCGDTPVTVSIDDPNTHGSAISPYWSDGADQRLDVSATGVAGSTIVYIPFSVNAMGEGNLGMDYTLDLRNATGFLGSTVSNLKLYRASSSSTDGDPCGGEPVGGLAGVTSVVELSPSVPGVNRWKFLPGTAAPGGTEATDGSSAESLADTEAQSYCLVATPKSGDPLASIYYQNTVVLCDKAEDRSTADGTGAAPSTGGGGGGYNPGGGGYWPGAGGYNPGGGGNTNNGGCKVHGQVNWWTGLSDIMAYGTDEDAPEGSTDISVAPDPVRPDGTHLTTEE